MVVSLYCTSYFDRKTSYVKQLYIIYNIKYLIEIVLKILILVFLKLNIE